MPRSFRDTVRQTTENKYKWYSLTSRQQDILKCIMRGLETTEMASEFNTSPDTVRVQMSDLYKNIHVKNRHRAMLWAILYAPGEIFTRILSEIQDEFDKTALQRQ